jgi:DUF971 family protein
VVPHVPFFGIGESMIGVSFHAAADAGIFSWTYVELFQYPDFAELHLER